MDPGYGFAHALLAMMYFRNWQNDFSNSNLALEKAYDLAKRAVELDSNESTCFSILGLICLWRRSFDVAVQFLRRASEINPNNQWNVADMGIVLMFVGESEAALASFKRAKEIDPYFDPPWYWHCLGLANMLLQRYEEAVTAFERVPVPDYWTAAMMAGCYVQVKDVNHAAVSVAECLGLRPDFSISRRMAKEPFKNPADATHLAECLQLAGLPE